MRNSWFVLAAALVAATSAFAYPTLNGATGLVAAPTACLMPLGTSMGAIDLVGADDAVNLRALWGVTPRFEAGIALSTGDVGGVAVSGKYQFPTSTNTPLLGALGGTLLVSDENAADGIQVYLVGTLPLGAVGSGQALGTAGLNYTNMDNASGVRPFAGLQLPLAAQTEVNADIILKTGDFANSVTSIALRHAFSERFLAQLGVTNAIGLDGGDDHDLLLGGALYF